MKKPVIYIPYWALEALKTRGMSTEKLVQWDAIASIFAPTDLAALLAVQRHPAVLTFNPSPTDSLFDVLAKRHQAPLQALDAQLDQAQQLSGSQAAQKFVEESLCGEPESDECPVEVVSVGDDVTGVILRKGALTYISDFNNHLPVLKQVLHNKMLGAKLSSVVQHDKSFLKNLIAHAARFGDYRPPNPVF